MHPQQLLPQDSLSNNAEALPPIPFIKEEIVISTDTAKKAKEKKMVAKVNKPNAAKDSLKESNANIAQKKESTVSSSPENSFDFTSYAGGTRPDVPVFKNAYTDKGVYVPSLFTGHELQFKEFRIEQIDKKNNDWLLILLLVALFIIAFVRVFQPKRLQQYLNSLKNESIAGKISREERVFSDLTAVLLFLSSLITISLFIYQVVIFYGFHFLETSYASIWHFSKILVLLLALIILNLIVSRTVGFIFKTGKLASDYVFSTVLFINVLSFLLLPIVIAIEYLPLIPVQNLIIAGAIITLLIFAYRSYRGLVLGNSEKVVSKFYLFLYLCTLEILPLMVLFKAFVSKA